MKHHALRNVLATALMLGSLNSVAETAVPEADILATVNGKAISIADRAMVSRQLASRGQKFDEKQILEELINMELMQQEATKRGLDKKPEILASLKLLKTRVLANAAISSIGEEIEITDEAIKQEYESQTAKIDTREYQASHILLKDEDTAKAVIKQLNEGADFAETAKEKSTGPSGPNGGDLGWFNSQSMVPEFSAAVASMKKGDHSSAPVKTQFGYHVIKLIDTRKTEAPTLDSVKNEIQAVLMQAKMSVAIENLRKAADIQIK